VTHPRETPYQPKEDESRWNSTSDSNASLLVDRQQPRPKSLGYKREDEDRGYESGSAGNPPTQFTQYSEAGVMPSLQPATPPHF